MSRIHLTLFTLSIAAAATAAGCSKSDKDGKGGAGGAGGGAAGPAAETTTLEINGFSVEAQVPKGWTRAEFGGGFLFTAPGKAVLPSTFFITPGCQGDCSKIAENVTGFAETQKKQHEASGYTVTIPSQGDLPEGGRELRIDATSKSGDLVQVIALHHRAGWDQIVTCSATLLKDDRALADAFGGWCRGLKITKK